MNSWEFIPWEGTNKCYSIHRLRVSRYTIAVYLIVHSRQTILSSSLPHALIKDVRQGSYVYLSYNIDFNVCDLCDALFSLCRVGGAKSSFSMVYKFQYSFLEDVLCSNHYHSCCHNIILCALFN